MQQSIINTRHDRAIRVNLVSIAVIIEVRFFSLPFQRICFRAIPDAPGRKGETLIQSGPARRSFFSRIFKHPRAEPVLAYKRVVVPCEEPSAEIDRVYIVARRRGRFSLCFFFGRLRQMRGTWHRWLRSGARSSVRNAHRDVICAGCPPKVNSPSR